MNFFEKFSVNYFKIYYYKKKNDQFVSLIKSNIKNLDYFKINQ